MLLTSVAAFFKYKIVTNIVILACWPPREQIKLLRQLHHLDLQATFACDPAVLNRVQSDKFLGVIVIGNDSKHVLEKIKLEHTSAWYKWLVIGEDIPSAIDSARYDADMTLLRIDLHQGIILNDQVYQDLHLDNIHINLGVGASSYPWAVWSSAGLQVLFDRERILRRNRLKGQPFRISTPLGHFANGLYNSTFEEYLMDDTKPEHDPTIRCGFGSSLLLSESLNATAVLAPTMFWTSEADNSSMLRMVSHGNAELTGSVLRILKARVEALDFVMPLWPFSVGFTYLAERESSGNMFVTPFSSGIWWSCLGAGAVLALVQRITARSDGEKDGAVYTVLATCLQQVVRTIATLTSPENENLNKSDVIKSILSKDLDASAVPVGASGRWTFMVLSIFSMLVHAYYTSAIVSALMSAGRSGPASLRELADSRYAIASEDYDYMRYFMFDRPSNRSDLEYLKKKKMTKHFYQSVGQGVQMISDGNTAFHAEYINIFPYINKFPDDKICQLAYVDTFSTMLAWTATTKRSQFTEVMRIAGNWLHETGLRTRLVSQWKSEPTPCRASLLAERVKFGDIAPLIGLTASCVALSIVILGLEILVAKGRKKSSVATEVSNDGGNFEDSTVSNDN